METTRILSHQASAGLQSGPPRAELRRGGEGERGDRCQPIRLFRLSRLPRLSIPARYGC